MDKQSALAIWQELYGDVDTAYDFASHPMKREDYQKEDSYYSWDIDAKMPYNSRHENFIPCSKNTISFRHHKNSFKVGNHMFEVRKGPSYGTFSIYDITDRQHPLNMDPTKENQDPEFNRARFHSIATSAQPKEVPHQGEFRVPTIHSINRNVFHQHLENADLGVEVTYAEAPSFSDEVKEEVQPEEKVEALDVVEEKKEEKNLKEILTDSLEEIQQVQEPVFTPVEETLENPWEEKEEEDDEIVLPIPEKEEPKEEKVNEENLVVADEVTVELQQKIDSYESLLKEKEEKISQLLLQADQFSKQKEEILSQKNNLSSLQECFSLRVQQLNQEKEKVLQENESIIAEKQQLIDQRDDFEKEKNYLQTQLDNQLISQNNNNASFIGANNALKERINSLCEDNEVKKEEISSLKEEKESLTSELEIAKEANTELSQQINMAQNERLAFLQEKEENERKINELLSKSEEAQKEVEQLKQQNSQIEALTTQSNQAVELASEKNNLLALKDTFSSYISYLNEKEEGLSNLNQNLFDQIEEQNKIIAELNQKLSELQKLDKDLNANYDQLDAQSQMVDDQLETINSENIELRKEIENLRAEHNDLLVQYQNQSINLDQYISGYDQLKQEKNRAESELEVVKDDRDRIQSRNDALNQQLAEKQNTINEKESRIAQINLDAEKEKQEKFEKILTLTAQSNDQANKLLFLSLNGCAENYLNVVKTINDRSLMFNEENIRQVLKEYPEWKVASANEMNENVVAEELDSEDVTYLSKDKEQREKAINYFLHFYHNEKTEVTDFAGRNIALADYRKKDSDKSWDYCLFDKDEMESVSNVFVANLKSIRDYRKNEVFVTNGHSYHYVDDHDHKRIESADYVTNPYDFESAIKISQLNKERTSPLVYIFVKCVPANASESAPKDISDFFDIMDRTAKRCCPLSFIEMKTYVGNGKGNYSFMTFDGNVEECYSEVMEYAMLLNSYRREFKNQGLFNAIIVVNQTEISYSKRHLDLDNLIKETKDVELRALNYVFNMMVIDSTIKRTIHIGPSVLDQLPLDRDYLQPSRIGQGNFAQIYNFKKEFKTYNVVYNLDDK